MKLNYFRDLVSLVKLLFHLLCIVVIGMSVNAEVFAGDISDSDLLKGEARYIDQKSNYSVLNQGGIVWDGENRNLLFEDPFKYQLAQHDKGKEPAEKTNVEEDTAKEQGAVKESGRGLVFGPIQYCQGKFKRLGGTGVEIITVRCAKADDSCNCEGEKKSPTKWVECGGLRKDSTIGSDLLSCESKIVGSGVDSDSE